MIPTSVTSSSPPQAGLGCIGNQTSNSPTIMGCAKSNNGAGVGTEILMGQGQGNSSVILGISSLILEGRALAEDEYVIQTTRYDGKKTSLSGNTIECGRQSPKPSTSRAAFGENISSSVMGNNTLSVDLVNYLGRKSSSHSPEASSPSFLRDYYNSSSSESASSSVESNHSRWSQKLSQLRQESPNAHHQAMRGRQKLAVECPRGSDAEFVALAINTEHHQYGINEDNKKIGDFEILRRTSINQMNFYNSPNSMVSGVGSGGGSGSSENFMFSLQSLASNTCLRVGSPLLLATNSPPPKYFNNRQVSSSTTRFAASQYQQQQQQQQQTDFSISTPSSSGIGSGVLNNSWYASSSPYTANSSSYKANTTTQRVTTPSPQFTNYKTLNSSTSSHNLKSNTFGRNNTNSLTPTQTTTKTTTASSSLSSITTTSRNKIHPQQGPHCDQFLKKMGLAKVEASEAEEHHCDMSYVNPTCTRWRAYCLKMENILSSGEPICIEVYLGPCSHKVLLEQWIITQKEKQPPPTMTLPSLCSAIRSQLYFSQISAWCDLIKKSDKTIMSETGRVIIETPNTTTTSAAGDLATTINNAITTAPTATSTTSTHHHTTTSAMTLTLSATSPTSPGSGSVVSGVCGGGGGGMASGVGCGNGTTASPRLNIFYRIKQYDNTACFNSKPNIHNFPNVNISENCCISVCLKSLPRIAGGIPKVGSTATTATAMPQHNIPASSVLVTKTPPLPTTTTTPPPVKSETPLTCLAANKNETFNAATAKATTSLASSTNAAKSAIQAVNAVTTTTNANNSTILKMNCDNNLKEHQQQQKTLTASTCSSAASSSTSSSSSLRCSYLKNKKHSKSFPGGGDNDNKSLNIQDMADVDFEYCNEQHQQQHINIDSNAGGDNTNHSFGDCDSSNSSLSTNNCGHLSHREKQLLKYRKRMLKRDKRQQLRKTNDNFSLNNQMQISTQQERINNTTNNNNNNNSNSNNINNNGVNKMEQGDEDEVDDVNDVEDNDDDDVVGNKSDTADCSSESNHSVNNSLTKGQRQKQQQQQQEQQKLPKIHNNSIPSSSTSISSSSYTINQIQHHVKMISTGTQTITNTCISCGSEKSMICLKCNPLRAKCDVSYADDDDNDNDDDDDDNVNITATTTTTTSIIDSSYNYEEIMDAETSSSSASSLSSSDIIHTPRNKAELLLQAIQRTPKSNKKYKHSKSKDLNQMAAIKKQQQQQHQQQKQRQLQLHNSPTATIPTTTTTLKNSNNKNLRNSPPNSNTLDGDNRPVSSHSRSSSTGSIINGVAVAVGSSSNSSSNNMIGCQMCKRQKTQHNFYQPSSEDLASDDNNTSLANNSLNSSSCGNVSNNTNQNKSSLTDDDKAADDDDDNEKDGGKNSSAYDCADNVSIVIDSDQENYVEKMSSTKTSCDSFNDNEVMEEECYQTSTKLTPQKDGGSLNTFPCYDTPLSSKSTNNYGTIGADTMDYVPRSCSTPPLDEQKENSSLAQFKTPTPNEQYQNTMRSKTVQPLQPHKHTPKPNLLHITCNFNKSDDHQQHPKRLSRNNTNMKNAPANQNPLLLRRSLPKVNLTPIFCNTNSMMGLTSSPIPIGNGCAKSADINVTQASPTFSFESPTSPAPSMTVQKSNSAPTLPNSPSLSPRFVKASSIYKRRSRHLSDRSDRSLGSDEQFSDEDIDSGMYSPFGTSPVKLRTRLSAVFGRKPLLGNLEESLLQRRLVPKTEVMGFKLLLGASGGFCPTQLTIPAAAYFYEFKGETLSTPYLCEIRLPRKGYTVPRCGTVQATLLNPMGTVVRMFVIPYDMRDMPTLHQTFIRQRILADTGMQTINDESQPNGLDNLNLNNIVSGNQSSSPITKHQIMLMQRQQQQHQSEKHHNEQPTTSQHQQQQLRSPQTNNENNLGHFISAENMKSLRYSIHLRFQTSRTGRLMLHTDIRLLISRRTDCDTAAAHAKGVLEAPNELITNTIMPTNPKYSARQDQTSSKI